MYIQLPTRPRSTVVTQASLIASPANPGSLWGSSMDLIGIVREADYDSAKLPTDVVASYASVTTPPDSTLASCTSTQDSCVGGVFPPHPYAQRQPDSPADLMGGEEGTAPLFYSQKSSEAVVGPPLHQDLHVLTGSNDQAIVAPPLHQDPHVLMGSQNQAAGGGPVHQDLHVLMGSQNQAAGGDPLQQDPHLLAVSHNQAPGGNPLYQDLHLLAGANRGPLPPDLLASPPAEQAAAARTYRQRRRSKSIDESFVASVQVYIYIYVFIYR